MNCKNALIVFMFFLIFSFCVMFIPIVSQFDIIGIKYVQNMLASLNEQIPIAAGGILFYIMTFLPLIFVTCYFLAKKMYRNMFLFIAVPFVSYFINSIVKVMVQRPRPPIELQIQEHMSSSSYVSRHTFVTTCVWGMFVYIVCLYCKNKFLKYFLISLSFIWVFFEGFSRVWLGVHNPTDVLGAFILACVFIILYIRLFQKLNLNR